MNKTLFQRITAALLPLIVAACAVGGSAQLTGVDERGARLAKAEAMFAERCKKAGVFIHRTAENVEGVFLMKLRPQEINHGNQYAMDDPYGRDHGGDIFVQSMLRGFNTPPSKPTAYTPLRLGYHYVEALDPKDGKRYRYTGRIEEPWRSDSRYSKDYKRFVLDKIPASGLMPRYGVTFEDISTHEERNYWIAGSSLKVIDLQTNEVMAERIGYMMDRGQGNTNSGRSPWLFAADNACPAFIATHGASGQPGQTELFTAKVLKPSLEK